VDATEADAGMSHNQVYCSTILRKSKFCGSFFIPICAGCRPGMVVNMETWDLFDAQRKPLYRVHAKGNQIMPGTFHIVVGIWVINSKNELLITKRSFSKEKYPGLWENTYGSLLAGEKSVSGAVRELYEETGIEIDEEMLTYCCTSKGDTSFVDMYILFYDISIDKLTMQEGETIAAKWVALEEFEKMFTLNLVSPLAIKRYYLLRDILNSKTASVFSTEEPWAFDCTF